MLNRKLRVLLIISYYHMLVYGLMPTTLKIGNCDLAIAKVSAGYMIYSVFLTVVLLLEVPCMMLGGLFSGYMRNNIVLQWALIVGLMVRIIAILSCYGLVWLQRQRLIQLYRDFLVHWRAHWQILCRVAGEESLERMQLILAGVLRRNLCINYAMLCCSILMQYRLLSSGNRLQLLMHAAAMLMVSVGRVGFFTLLLLLNHQFLAVQLSLQALCRRVRSRSQEDLRRIAGIHAEWVILARRAFSIYDVANASIFLNMFAVNVNILYHAVQFANQTIESDSWGFLIGDGLIVFNFWNSALIMNMLDSAINSCNDSAQLVKQFNNLHTLSPESEKEVCQFSKFKPLFQICPFCLQLELFVIHLRNNRLVYRICGCVVLDKPACLGYLATVLCHVIFLMQFDLKRRYEEGLTN